MTVSTGRVSSGRAARFALIAIGAGTVLRAVLGLWLHPPLHYVYSDMQGYVTGARRLASGVALNRFDTFVPPGTRILLSLPLRIFGTGQTGLWAASVLWFALSSAVPLLAWRFSLRVMTPNAAALTTALCAVWPLFIVYGAFFMSEIPSLFFLLLTLWLAFKVRETTGGRRVAFAVAAGLAAGAALTFRPQLVLNLAIAAVTMLGAKRSVRVAAAGALGLVLPLGAVLVLNAHAAGRAVGISENAGLNFFQGHCSVRNVQTAKEGVGVLEFASPVAVQQGRGRDYSFPDHIAWEQSFFFRQGLKCIQADGVGHVLVLARNVADLGITSVPWPPSNEAAMRLVVRPTNLAYSWALPTIIVVAAALAIEQRNARRIRAQKGEGGGPIATATPRSTILLIAHLACVLPTAIVFYGDPRFRVPYDVFGLALLAILLSTYRARVAKRPQEDDPKSPTGGFAASRD